VHDWPVDALELTVDPGRPASAGRFFHVGADLLALLDELSDLPVGWRVEELRTGSAVARLAPPEDSPADARHLRVVVDSLAAVQGGGPLPEDWTPDAVKAAHRLVEDGQAAEGESDWAPPRLRLVRDDGPGPAVDLTPGLLEGLATLQPFERDMPGSVRGTLVGFNVSRGNRASLRLPTRRVVRVAFPSALRERMRDALLQDVELRQDGEGRVFKVKADEVEVLAEPEAGWADLFGAAPGYTGGVPVDEWLEAHRGEA
jgi:bifunctional DNA-binding transcriptional regulator/antitoxin component of YhaV-PrlF toxin-antitoxin module